MGAVDVLCVAEPQAGDVLPGECSLAAGDVELDQHLASGVDVKDVAAAAVLDPLVAGLVVLVDEDDAVALADAVVHAGHWDFEFAEFASECA